VEKSPAWRMIVMRLSINPKTIQSHKPSGENQPRRTAKVSELNFYSSLSLKRWPDA
jgi:hypothetical protein